jgi:hypothetical protein
MTQQTEHLNEPIRDHARKDFTTLRDNLTIQEALGVIRQRGVGE